MTENDCSLVYNIWKDVIKNIKYKIPIHIFHVDDAFIERFALVRMVADSD